MLFTLITEGWHRNYCAAEDAAGRGNPPSSARVNGPAAHTRTVPDSIPDSIPRVKERWGMDWRRRALARRIPCIFFLPWTQTVRHPSTSIQTDQQEPVLHARNVSE